MAENDSIKTNSNLVEALGYYIKNKRLQKNIGLREMAEMLKNQSGLFIQSGIRQT